MFNFLRKNLTDIFKIHRDEDIRTIALFGRSAKNNSLKEAVRKADYTDSDGKEFNDFDIVRIEFKDKLPANPYQPENLFYDESFRRQKIGTWTP